MIAYFTVSLISTGIKTANKSSEVKILAVKMCDVVHYVRAVIIANVPKKSTWLTFLYNYQSLLK